MRIVLTIVPDSTKSGHVGTPGSNPGGPGHRYYWTEDIRLKEFVPDRGAPYVAPTQNQQLAGTHSGFSTVLRIASANDRFYEPDSYLFHIEVLYWFQPAPGIPLPAGQITTEGLFNERPPNFVAITPHALAITGGTGPYRTARGQVTESTIDPVPAGGPRIPTKVLDIQL